MSESERDWTARFVSIEASSSFESDESALEALVHLKEIDFGDLFTNRDTQLDSEESEGIAITFFHDEMANYLSLQTIPDSELQIRMTLADESVNQSSTVLNEILRFVESIVPDETYLFKEFDIPFRSLDLPIEDETELNIIGIRIQQDGAEYVIQESEDDDIGVTMRVQEDDPVESFDDSFIPSKFETLTRFIEEDL